MRAERGMKKLTDEEAIELLNSDRELRSRVKMRAHGDAYSMSAQSLKKRIKRCN
jgi:uncharacterized membrane protein YkoI